MLSPQIALNFIDYIKYGLVGTGSCVEVEPF
jgi:hypothetical protein